MPSKNPVVRLATQRKWKALNKERVTMTKRGWYKANAVRELAKQRKRAGLPEPLYPAPPGCEVCGQNENRALCLDHDHVTGKFRGWLCRNCNLTLGYVKDSPQRLRKLASYIENGNCLQS